MLPPGHVRDEARSTADRNVWGTGMAIDVAQWLRGLGLEQYASILADNDIDASLAELSADDLTALGITSVGDRRRLLSAIAALGATPQPAPAMAVTDTTAELTDVIYSITANYNGITINQIAVSQ
jgi:hypothetical protein